MRRIFLTIAASAALVLAMACSSDDDGSDDQLQVVASTALIAELASIVGGDAIEVTTLIPAGVDIHSYEPAPGVAASIAEADLVFVNGFNLEESLLDIVTENAAEGTEVVPVAAGLTPLEGGHHHHDHDDHEDGDEHKDDDDHDHEDGDEHKDEDDHDHEDGEEHEEGDDHDHEDGEEHDEGDDHDHEDGEEHEEGDDHDHEDGEEHKDDDDHDHEGEDHGSDVIRAGGDPHFWLAVENVIHYVEQIEAHLSELDADNADDYEERASDYVATLEELDDEIAATLSTIPEGQREMVVFHDAYQYFAEHYEFELSAALLPGNAQQDPSAEAVVDLIELINERSIPAVFREPQYNASVLETIADETGTEVFTIHSTYSDGIETYVDLMRANAESLASALGG